AESEAALARQAAALMLPGHVVNDRALGEEVIGDRVEVGVVQISEAVLDGLSHRSLDFALRGRDAGLQQLDDVLAFPLAYAGDRVRRDIGNELAIRSVRRAAQPHAGP